MESLASVFYTLDPIMEAIVYLRGNKTVDQIKIIKMLLAPLHVLAQSETSNKYDAMLTEILINISTVPGVEMLVDEWIQAHPAFGFSRGMTAEEVIKFVNEPSPSIYDVPAYRKAIPDSQIQRLYDCAILDKKTTLESLNVLYDDWGCKWNDQTLNKLVALKGDDYRNLCFFLWFVKQGYNPTPFVVRATLDGNNKSIVRYLVEQGFSYSDLCISNIHPDLTIDFLVLLKENGLTSYNIVAPPPAGCEKVVKWIKKHLTPQLIEC